jgi:hypothetical protein
MGRIFSNGPAKDFVMNPFTGLVSKASQISIAAPYVTKTDALLDAARSGKRVDLLVGLNAITTPAALAAVYQEPNIRVRYYAHPRFHAKIYIFDAAAMLGSSNLTDGGLLSNREATILLEDADDPDAIVELRAVFKDLWEHARALTPEILKRFVEARKSITAVNADDVIAGKVGNAEPPNINVDSQHQTSERMFLEGLRRQVMEYGNAFSEITRLLLENNLHRAELDGIGPANQTNRFLSWVRVTHAPGDQWQSVQPRPHNERREEILRLGREWIIPANDSMHEEYLPSLRQVHRIFGDADALQAASKESLTEGLTSLHAFSEQLRFVKGGAPSLPIVFWKENNEDVDKVRKTLKYWVHGGGDFVERLHDILYDDRMKLRLFGTACSLELYGTINPNDCPPVNGRIIKGLRYLGFDVRTA